LRYHQEGGPRVTRLPRSSQQLLTQQRAAATPPIDTVSEVSHPDVSLFLSIFKRIIGTTDELQLDWHGWNQEPHLKTTRCFNAHLSWEQVRF